MKWFRKRLVPESRSLRETYQQWEMLVIYQGDGICDLDGTLFDATPDQREITTKMLHAMRVGLISQGFEVRLQLVGRTKEEIR